jgi:hypothetical protein
VPASVLNAVRLMYAGAVYALLYGVGSILVVNAYVKHHPPATGHYDLGGVVTGIVFLSLVEIVLWVRLARACQRGSNPGRITSTVLFGLYTVATFSVLSSSGLVAVKLLTVVSWLIACTAVVLLWQPPSNAFFRGSRNS